jgi:hypothetical protein
MDGGIKGSHCWKRKLAARAHQKSKQFIFEKKNQKTFAYKARALPQRARLISKSFCFFFQKEALS